MVTVATALGTELPTAVSEKRYAALVQAIEQRRSLLVRVAQRMMPCPEDAEDVVQESLLKALTRLSEFRGDSRIYTWLHAIVINTARSWMRSQRGRFAVSLEPVNQWGDDTRQREICDPGGSPEECCSLREMRQVLLTEIGNLDPVYGEPIKRCYLGEHTYREAAAALGLRVVTIRARLHRGRMLLKRKMASRASSRSTTIPTGLTSRIPTVPFRAPTRTLLGRASVKPVACHPASD